MLREVLKGHNIFIDVKFTIHTFKVIEIKTIEGVLKLLDSLCHFKRIVLVLNPFNLN